MTRRLFLILAAASFMAGCASTSTQPVPFNDGGLGMRLLAAGQPMTSAQRAAILSGSPMPATPTYAAPIMPMRTPVMTQCGRNGAYLQCSTY